MHRIRYLKEGMGYKGLGRPQNIGLEGSGFRLNGFGAWLGVQGVQKLRGLGMRDQVFQNAQEVLQGFWRLVGFASLVALKQV